MAKIDFCLSSCRLLQFHAEVVVIFLSSGALIPSTAFYWLKFIAAKLISEEKNGKNLSVCFGNSAMQSLSKVACWF